MDCFLCDQRESVPFNINHAKTKYRKIPLASILHEFAGENIEIAIGSNETICNDCKLLLDEWDHAQNTLKNIENIISHKLYRKYHIDVKTKLPPIELNASTVNLFDKGEHETKFQCKMCSFSTNSIDNLVPHQFFHRNSETEENMNYLPCTECHLLFPSTVLQTQHLTTFHLSSVVVDPDSHGNRNDGIDTEKMAHEPIGVIVCAVN